MKPAHAVLFDATGVLITLRDSVGDRYAEVAARHGVELPGWRLDDAFQRVLARMPPRVFPGCGADETARRERAWWREVVRQTLQATDSTVRFADFDAFFDALYGTFAGTDAWQLTPGAREALGALQAESLRLGIVSNFDHRLPNLLEALGVAQYFGIVMLPARCGSAKPEAAIFRSALEALGVSAEHAVYVGHDPEVDEAGARAAGLRTILVGEDGDLATLPTRLRALANLTD